MRTFPAFSEASIWGFKGLPRHPVIEQQGQIMHVGVKGQRSGMEKSDRELKKGRGGGGHAVADSKTFSHDMAVHYNPPPLLQNPTPTNPRPPHYVCLCGSTLPRPVPCSVRSWTGGRGATWILLTHKPQKIPEQDIRPALTSP